MPEFEKHTNRDYSKFDAMSTEALNELLRQDSQLPEDEESDLDAIIYIMEVITKRENEKPEFQFTDVNTAWNSFKYNYQPSADDGSSLYDFDEELSPTLLHDSDPSSIKIDGRSNRHSRRGFIRVACIAAAMVIVVFAGSLTAYAMGYDLWSSVATWTRDIFGFEMVTTAQPESDPSPKEIPEQLKDLDRMFSEHGLSNLLLPSYIPDGYIQSDIKCTSMTSSTNFYCLLTNGENSITLLYSAYSEADLLSQFEKDLQDPEIYNVDETKYYIMTNENLYFATWIDGNVECSISGISSHDEIIRIIDSIN